MTRWTQADVNDVLHKREKQSKPSKYRNVKVIVDGLAFDSKHEAQVYNELKLRQKAGEIHDLQCQVRYNLLAPVPASTQGRCEIVAVYIADFVYVESKTGATVVADAKGMRTQMYRLKKKWMRLQNRIEILEL